jgi:hypothetical protein
MLPNPGTYGLTTVITSVPNHPSPPAAARLSPYLANLALVSGGVIGRLHIERFEAASIVKYIIHHEAGHEEDKRDGDDHRLVGA